jgi:hypothetical protein
MHEGQHPLSEAQWVFVRVAFDRVDPIDLATAEQRELAAKMFGACDRVDPESRRTVAMLKGARAGGTYLWSLYLLYRCLTADLSQLAPGEVAFAPVVCPQMDVGQQTINYIKGGLLVAGLDWMRQNDALQSVVIKRADGATVIVEIFAAARGGSSVRGKTFVAALMDEACFFRGQETGVVNDEEIHAALFPRVMRSGTVGLVSTAWAEEGKLWGLVVSNLGRPGTGPMVGNHTTALACITPTEVLRQDENSRLDIAAVDKSDPEKANREYRCIPLSKNTSQFFPPAELRRCEELGEGLLEDLRPTRMTNVGAGWDMGLVHDSAASVIVHEEEGVYTVASIIERQPEPGAPLKLSEVCAEFESALQLQHCYQATADQYEFEASKEHLDGIELLPAPTGIGGKTESYTLVRQLMREGRLRIPPCYVKLLAQLKEVVSKPAEQGKLRIWSPRSKSGHGDLVSALVNAIWQLHDSDGSMMAALRASLERRKTA